MPLWIMSKLQQDQPFFSPGCKAGVQIKSLLASMCHVHNTNTAYVK